MNEESRCYWLLQRIALFSILSFVVTAMGCVSSSHDPTGLRASDSNGDRAEAHRLLTLSIDDYVEQTIRVQRIGDRVRIAGAGLCADEIGPILGVAVLDIEDLHPTLLEIASERFSEADRLHVIAVFENSVAARAGIETGDSILSIGHVRMKSLAAFSKLRPPNNGQSLEIKIVRSGVPLEFDVPYVAGCRIPVGMIRRDARNAFTNFSQIRVLSGIIRVFDDSRVAFIIGHEIGHTIVRKVLKRFGGGPKIETLSDYYGVYLAALAGFESIETNVWEQFQRDLKSLDDNRRRTHPLTHERTAALRDAVAEVRSKIKSGTPLEPEIEER